jgi:hypothetical protein
MLHRFEELGLTLKHRQISSPHPELEKQFVQVRHHSEA